MHTRDAGLGEEGYENRAGTYWLSGSGRTSAGGLLARVAAGHMEGETNILAQSWGICRASKGVGSSLIMHGGVTASTHVSIYKAVFFFHLSLRLSSAHRAQAGHVFTTPIQQC